MVSGKFLLKWALSEVRRIPGGGRLRLRRHARRATIGWTGRLLLGEEIFKYKAEGRP